jgi:hypothetical protein
MNKKRNEELMQKADKALHDTTVKILNQGKGEIKDSYNGQTAALGVTIAMSGLRPALAIYQKDTGECDRIQILNAIAFMNDIVSERGEKPGETLFRKVLQCNDEELKDLKKKIIDSAIALKQVIRTYKLVK